VSLAQSLPSPQPFQSSFGAGAIGAFAGEAFVVAPARCVPDPTPSDAIATQSAAERTRRGCTTSELMAGGSREGRAYVVEAGATS
jgi:hypothetical protein